MLYIEDMILCSICAYIPDYTISHGEQYESTTLEKTNFLELAVDDIQCKVLQYLQ
jgi:hypothetical protein